MLLGYMAEGGELTDTSIGGYNIDSPLCSTNSLVQAIQAGHFGNVPLGASDVVADRLHCLIEFSLAASGNENDAKAVTSLPNLADSTISPGPPIPMIPTRLCRQAAA